MEDFSIYNGEGTVLRKVQLRQVEILVEIDKICRKHNIQYWIEYGTLLGAVRHGGFIPWDDDIDISIPTPDLQRFIDIASNELPDWLFLQTKETDPSFYGEQIRVRDKNTLYIMPHDDFSKDYQKGIFIDIFEIQTCHGINPKLLKRFCRWYRKITGFNKIRQLPTLKNAIATITFPLIKPSLDILWFFLNLGKKDRITYKKEMNYGYSYTKDIVFPLKDISFEGHVFVGPADPDRYLTVIYGDYMKIPPKEKRAFHMAYVIFNSADQFKQTE